jgi:hypothetical protein
MSALGVEGGKTVAAAVGRLARVGRVPGALSGSPLGGIAGRPLGGLLAEDVVGAAGLEAVLALLASAGRGAAVEEIGMRARPVVDSGPVRARPAAPPDAAMQVAHRVPRPAGSKSAQAPRGFPSASAPAEDRLERAEREADAPWRDRPATLDERLSRTARIGASTPVGLPIVHAGESVLPAAGAAPARSGLPAAPARDARGSRPEPGPPTSTAVRRTSLPLDPAVPAAVGDLPSGDGSFVRRREGELTSAPVAGLAGLVSWWSAQEAARVPDGAAAAPPVTGRSVTWSAGDEPPRAAPGTADAALEAAPLVRLSLRGALEELLLAEARASGIEVYP